VGLSACVCFRTTFSRTSFFSPSLLSLSFVKASVPANVGVFFFFFFFCSVALRRFGFFFFFVPCVLILLVDDFFYKKLGIRTIFFFDCKHTPAEGFFLSTAGFWPVINKNQHIHTKFRANLFIQSMNNVRTCGFLVDNDSAIFC
jgi:hypothetical protein